MPLNSATSKSEIYMPENQGSRSR